MSCRVLRRQFDAVASSLNWPFRVYSDWTRQRQIDGVSIVYIFWCDAAGLNAPIDKHVFQFQRGVVLRRHFDADASGLNRPLGRLSIDAVLGRTAGLQNGARKPHTIR